MLYLPIPACSVMWTATPHPRTLGQRAPLAKLSDPHRTSPSSSHRGRRDRYDVCLGPTILHYSSPSTTATPSPPASLSSPHDRHRSSSRAGLTSTVLRSALIALMKLKKCIQLMQHFVSNIHFDHYLVFQIYKGVFFFFFSFQSIGPLGRCFL